MKTLFGILMLLPITIGIPVLILYFIIKLAIKYAAKELKKETHYKLRGAFFYYAKNH